MKRATLTAMVLALSLSFMSPRITTAQNYNFTDNGEIYVNHVLKVKRGEGNDKKENTNKAIGLPKKDVYDSFNLGFGGEIIVGYTFSDKNPMKKVRCFLNKEGWDIGIHEGKGSNIIENILVYTTEEKEVNEDTRWIKLGKFNVRGTKDNLIRINLPDNVKKGYWVKVKDSKEVYSPRPGFDLSTIVYRYPCPPESKN